MLWQDGHVHVTLQMIRVMEVTRQKEFVRMVRVVTVIHIINYNIQIS